MTTGEATADPWAGTAGRRWRWSPLRELGWSRRLWTEECLTDDVATWYARLATTPETTMPPVVLVHGVVVSGAYFRPVADYLDEHLRLYIPDLPGFGRSRSHTGVWTMERLATGLAEWLDAHAIAGAVLIGNSLGCQVLTLLAERRPDLVRTLILVAPTVDPAAPSLIGQVIRGMRDMPKESPSIWTVWIPDLFRSGVRRALVTLVYGVRDPQRERLARIEAPVVVVAGERDPIAPPEWVRAMAASMPRGRAIVIPGAPHAMNYSNPRQLGRIIRVAIGMSSRGCL